MSGSAPLAPSTRVSYGSIVWAQLRRNRLALAGIWCIAVLFLLAVYAPFFYLDQPFFWSGGGDWHMPFFGALFNRLLFENSVDLFFNLLLLLSPILVGVYFGVRRALGPRGPAHRRRRLGWLLLGEPVGPSLIGALGLVALGLVLINRQVPQKVRSTASSSDGGRR